MTTAETTTEAKAAAPKKAPAKRKAVKKAKAAKKGAKKAPKAKKESKPRTAKWSKYRAPIIKALKQLGATSATASRTAAQIAKKAGLTESNVKWYCGQGQLLVKEGYVQAAQLEEYREHTFYLTAKGAHLDVTKLS